MPHNVFFAPFLQLAALCATIWKIIIRVGTCALSAGRTGSCLPDESITAVQVSHPA